MAFSILGNYPCRFRLFSKGRRRELESRALYHRCFKYIYAFMFHLISRPNEFHWLTRRQFFSYLVAIAYVDIIVGNRVRGDYDDRRQSPEGGQK